ncbi:Xaa-Pro peptidase family protein [Carboxydocella sp. ULO1]|uniref:M24 family metallopeptidase n=1 Tax=Carboxydocella sp. ULO1 TaxID=1926599 RepID=UPI0009ABCE57|nr:Xaa-Pro peptidase family protein [Carboxydocella sp. ULO1]GAW28455.1 hypothetical protein ULO1_10250 [Carboxydocella sp. ULO1]
MNSRVHKLRQYLQQEKLEGYLVNRPENRRYLSGFTGSNGWLLITEKDTLLLTDFRYLEQAAAQAEGWQVIDLGNQPMEKLVQTIRETGISNVGFEADFLPYKQGQTLQEKLKPLELVAREGLVERLRWLKDEQELALIEKAVHIADQAFERLLPVIKPGISELELALELEFILRRLGSEGLAFPSIVASGPRSSLPHATPSQRQLQAGDFLKLDFGAVWQGYHSDMTRTVVLGKATAEQKKVYETVLAAQLQALAVIRPGLTGREVDKVARDLISAAGYGRNFGHGLGHSLGLVIHEEPRLSPQGDVTLAPGMVLTVEPGIYLPGWGGVRIEDVVVVTPEGCRVLTKAPKTLLEIEL